MENIQTGVNDIAVEQKESIKLIKNSRGMNWEIRLLSLDLDELERLNNEMIKRFGDKGGYEDGNN